MRPRHFCSERILTVNTVIGDRFVSEAADDAQRSTGGCMDGTREKVLTMFVQWAISDPKRIFWLAGMAGTGKTSIALTLCRMLRSESAVFFGGGFFCSRSSGTIAQTDVRRILPTLARLLAGSSPEFAAALAVELGKADRIATKPVREQIGPFLRQPLSALAPSSRPIVFVIDALDEIADKSELTDNSELAELLNLIADFQSAVPVKFILTSRPEINIRGTRISNPEHNAILKLHELDPLEVKQDIHRYIYGTLEKNTNGSTWYSPTDVDTLVQLSNYLFIFASTALDYVLGSNGDVARRVRLHEIISAVAEDTPVTARLDMMYELVIARAAHSTAISMRGLDRLKSIIACILTSRLTLSVQALAELMELEPDLLRSSLERLHAMIHVPDDNNTPDLHAVHASFGDYLFDRAADRIRIPRSHGHDTLAHACLDVMKKKLHFNISQSRSSYEPNPSTKPESINLSLEYACLHWAHHAIASSTPALDLKIGQIFRPKLLFWLELLSVMQKVSLAGGLLRIAASAVSLLL